MILERLDKILIARKLVANRIEAERTIKEIGVKVNGKLITKPGKKFDSESAIELAGQENPYVNVNGLKLSKAISEWGLDLQSKTILDIGSGDGGCAEFLLENDVESITCIDKTKELNSDILSNEKVTFHKSGFRELTKNLLPNEFDMCILDIDSAPLKEILPFIQGYVKPKGEVLMFFKPQMETEKKELNKLGLLKDPKLIPLLKHHMQKEAELNQLTFIADFESPILGDNGNREYIFHFIKK